MLSHATSCRPPGSRLYAAVRAALAVALFAARASALLPTDAVKINEVCYDPVEIPEESYEFLELYNAGPGTAYLDGAVITDEGNSGTGEATFVFPGTSGGTTIALAPGGRLLLAVDATGCPYPSIAYEFYGGAPDSDDPAVPNLVRIAGTAADLLLGNTGDGVTLSTGQTPGMPIPCGEMVDGASWETGGAPDQTALGASVCADPLPDPGYANTTQSLQRLPDGFDTDASTDADFQLARRTPAVLNGTTLPPDFHLLAASGGLTPWENIYRVEIDVAGQGDFRYAEPAARQTDTWTQIVPFTVSSEHLLDLWATIEAQGFFLLPPASYDPLRHDGWFCDIVVTANGTTHHVKVQNFTLPPFNAVAIEINEKTPPGNDLVYNDITP